MRLTAIFLVACGSPDPVGEAEGYEIGLRWPADHELPDQHGELRKIRELKGNPTLVQITALWMVGEDRFQEDVLEFGPDATWIPIVIQNQLSEPPTVEDAAAWSDAFGHEVVLWDEFPDEYANSLQLPQFWALDPCGYVVSQGSGGDAVRAALVDYDPICH